MSDAKTQSKTDTQKRSTAIIIALIALVVIAFSVIIFLLVKPKKVVNDNNPTVNGGRGTVITQDNVSEVANATVQDNYYMTSMSINWHFNGLTSKDAYVENAPENTRTVYFDLYRTDNGEIIYSSPYIPVGEKLNGLTLDKALDDGTYETILVYHLVDDDKNELSTLSVSLKIYVTN